MGDGDGYPRESLSRDRFLQDGKRCGKSFVLAIERRNKDGNGFSQRSSLAENSELVRVIAELTGKRKAQDRPASLSLPAFVEFVRHGCVQSEHLFFQVELDGFKIC
jgi:hypothetical protein